MLIFQTFTQYGAWHYSILISYPVSCQKTISPSHSKFQPLAGSKQQSHDQYTVFSYWRFIEDQNQHPNVKWVPSRCKNQFYGVLGKLWIKGHRKESSNNSFGYGFCWKQNGKNTYSVKALVPWTRKSFFVCLQKPKLHAIE